MYQVLRVTCGKCLVCQIFVVKSYYGFYFTWYRGYFCAWDGSVSVDNNNVYKL